MARKLDRYRETARMVLEPWIVETALARLGPAADARESRRSSSQPPERRGRCDGRTGGRSRHEQGRLARACSERSYAAGPRRPTTQRARRWPAPALVLRSEHDSGGARDLLSDLHGTRKGPEHMGSSREWSLGAATPIAKEATPIPQCGNIGGRLDSVLVARRRPRPSCLHLQPTVLRRGTSSLQA